jgi:hypothetical protein
VLVPVLVGTVSSEAAVHQGWSTLRGSLLGSMSVSTGNCCQAVHCLHLFLLCLCRWTLIVVQGPVDGACPLWDCLSSEGQRSTLGASSLFGGVFALGSKSVSTGNCCQAVHRLHLVLWCFGTTHPILLSAVINKQ